MLVTAANIRPAITAHPDVIDRALEALYPDPGAPLNLDGLRMAAGGGEDEADILLAHLNHDKLLEQFVSFLRARGIDPLQPASVDEVWDADTPFDGEDIGDPDPSDFNEDALSDFLPRGQAFRCRIMVDGEVKGSGAFVSPRLAITSAHVIEALTDARKAAAGNGAGVSALPEVKIKASDGREYPARYAWHLCVHPNEHQGKLPPKSAKLTHCDVALLKVMLPLGQSFGRIALPDPTKDRIGPQPMALVHFPDGQKRGFTQGKFRRQTADDIRLPHDVGTMGGSSGGPCFDRDLRFIGLHQGRWQGFRRLVPYNLFAANTKFREVIEGDRPPRYLWSLDRNLDGPIIVGRRQFFTALASILDAPDSLLRGVWVRRLRTDLVTGLGFSFEMMRAFFAQQEPPGAEPKNVCVPVPTEIGSTDLIGYVATEVFGSDDAATARIGVRAGETSDVAAQRDRAAALASALNAKAEAEDKHYWFFFEEPPSRELGEAAKVQFEHLAEWLVAQKQLRLVLAGFEQYALAPLRFQQVAEAATARRPGLLVDPLGNFTRADVAVTLKAILRDLNDEEDIEPAVMDDMLEKITQGMTEVRTETYDFSELGPAVKGVRRAVKFRMGLD